MIFNPDLTALHHATAAMELENNNPRNAKLLLSEAINLTPERIRAAQRWIDHGLKGFRHGPHTP